MTHQELKGEMIMQKGKSKDLEVTDICTFAIFLRAQKMHINNKKYITHCYI